MNKKVIGVVAVILLIVVFMVFKLKSNKENIEKKVYIHDTEAPVLIEVNKPAQHTFDKSFSYLGVFEPNVQNTVGAEGGGKVIQISFQEGDYVSKGKVLARLDSELIRMQLKAAEVNLKSLKNDQKRNANLQKDNAISNVQVEKTDIGVETAEIQVEQLKKQLSNTNIIAPFSGVITKKMIDLGSVIGIGTPVAEITDIDQLKLSISVPERDIMKFKIGQDVQTTIDVLDNKSFKGKVNLINIQADKSHNFKVQVLVKNNQGGTKIMSGMYGKVDLQNNTAKTALAISRKALIGSTKKPQVYVAKNGKVKLISFTAGIADGEFIEVVSGLNSNDQVVVKGQVNLKDNSNVKINN